MPAVMVRPSGTSTSIRIGWMYPATPIRLEHLESPARLGPVGPPVARRAGRCGSRRAAAVRMAMASPPRPWRAIGCRLSVRAHFSHTCGEWYQASRRASHRGRSMSRPSRASRAGRSVVESSTATATTMSPPMPDAPGLDQRREEERAESHHDGEPRGDHRRRRPSASCAIAASRRRQPAAQLLPEPGHDQQRIVDADAEPDHRRHVEHEDRHRRDRG